MQYAAVGGYRSDVIGSSSVDNVEGCSGEETESCSKAHSPPYFDSPSFGRIHVSDALCSDLVTPLLVELREEPCGHSWQPLLAGVPPARVFDVLAEAIARGRPGRVFTYFRETPSGREAIAVGAVGDRVTTSFLFEGLPVLGRAFIRRAYRSQRLYPAILAHRLEYCRSRWGARLMAVHLGASTPRVERSFRRIHRGRVVYVGDEDLGEAGSVRALLGLTAAFERSLVDAVLPGLRTEHAAVLQFLVDGATATRISEIGTPLERLALHHAGFEALRCFLGQLPTLR